jgi:AraC-like DNA-binding protein/ligand-binding sensor protein
MQATLPLTPSSGTETTAADHRIAPQLQRSEIFRDYQAAFETTTGLPLALRPIGSLQSPLHASKNVNAFCALMAASNQTCAACLRMQQRVESEAATEARTFTCFAGLSESAVPVRVGAAVVGHLQTGQIMLRPPTQAGFKRVLAQLAAWGVKADARKLAAAYFQTRVLAKKQYEATVRLVSVFAQHLGAFGNQVVVMESTAESPVVAKARAFIAGHHGEELSLAQVSHAVNMSAFYFCKVFKKATGLTFTDYVARVRIEAVRQLLLNPHKRVSEAAYEAGFQSLSQFNRTFRRIVGESPSDYRERLHGGAAAGGHLHALPHAA